MSKPSASQVLRLPRLLAGSACWHLPLNDHATFELVRVLLLDDLAERELVVAELMSVDPALTLWAVCAAGSAHGAGAAGASGPETPRCVLDLAQWFARHALQLLRWTPEDVSGLAAARDVRARWRELAVDAVAVATIAADQLSDDAVAAEAFLFGLLRNAPDWLRSCGPRVSLARPTCSCLPDWLMQLLRERSRGGRGEVVEQVTRAMKLWRESGRKGRRVAEIDVTEALLTRRRWQASGRGGEGAQHLLVQLTERLRRLHALEHDFQHLLEQQRLASLGELAYGASHEINNPLANISTRAQTLLADESDPERRRTLAIINTQALRANEMIADMMLFARPPELVCQEFNLVALVENVVRELADEARLQGTELLCRSSLSQLTFQGDVTQLAAAIRAVCVNALEAIGAEGELEVTVEQSEAAGDGSLPCARVAIRDTGPGLTPHVRRHMFDPFFSGREAGRGLGFGLSKCWRIVTLHAGRIDVTSQLRQGTTLVIELPMSHAASPSRAGAEPM